jgi:hypothetical protein
MSLTRRSLSRLVAGGSLFAAAAVPAHAAGAIMQSNAITSGGIGLTRTEFERYFGAGEATQSHGLYRDPTYGGPIYVGFDFVSFQDGLLDFLELQWAGISQAGGLSQDDAAREVSTVMPSDAVFQKRYVMGATPGGPIGLRSEEWTSASLGAATGGRSSILVTYQERIGSLPGSTGMDFIVSAASIAVQE